jgi:hypothetical protein
MDVIVESPTVKVELSEQQKFRKMEELVCSEIEEKQKGGSQGLCVKGWDKSYCGNLHYTGFEVEEFLFHFFISYNHVLKYDKRTYTQYACNEEYDLGTNVPKSW